MIVCSLLVFLPAAHAENAVVWDFAKRTAPNTMQTQSITNIQQIEEGVAVRTQTNGFLSWSGGPLRTPVDVITLTVRSTRPTEAAWMWSPKDKTLQGLYQVFFRIPANSAFTEVHVPISSTSTWFAEADVQALALPSGSDIVIQKIAFRHWNVFEKSIESIKSFWTFDQFTQYSINFLWGPLLATNPIARSVLYATLPPPSWSALRVFYALTACAAAVAAALRFGMKNAERGKRIGLLAVTSVVAFLWILFDARMGLELLSYARTDITSYVRQDKDTRTLRANGPLNAFLDHLRPTLQQYPRYALLASDALPFFANFRYQTYPSVPVMEGQDMDDIALWLVIERQDIAVDETGRLLKKTGTGYVLLSPKGHIVERFSPSIFLFQTDTP